MQLAAAWDAANVQCGESAHAREGDVRERAAVETRDGEGAREGSE